MKKSEKTMIHNCGKIISEATKPYKKENLNWEQAVKEMKKGKFVTIPSWHKETGSKTYKTETDAWFYLNDLGHLCCLRIEHHAEDLQSEKPYYQQTTDKKDLIISTRKQPFVGPMYDPFFNPISIFSNEFVAVSKEDLNLVSDAEYFKKMNNTNKFQQLRRY